MEYDCKLFPFQATFSSFEPWLGSFIFLEACFRFPWSWRPVSKALPAFMSCTRSPSHCTAGSLWSKSHNRLYSKKFSLFPSKLVFLHGLALYLSDDFGFWDEKTFYCFSSFFFFVFLFWWNFFAPRRSLVRLEELIKKNLNCECIMSFRGFYHQSLKYGPNSKCRLGLGLKFRSWWIYAQLRRARPLSNKVPASSICPSGKTATSSGILSEFRT